MDMWWFEQIAANVPSGNDWLSPAESDHLRELRFPKRRADWLLGRWTAKNAVALVLDIPSDLQTLGRIEIRARPSGAPEVFVKNENAPVAISLSHRTGVAACAIAPSGASVGCDLEIAESHGEAFESDYFTAEEQALSRSFATDHQRVQLLAVLWSAKESTLKAMGVGLRWDTRQLTVSLPGIGTMESKAKSNQYGVFSGEPALGGHDWSALQVGHDGGEAIHGWWNQSGDLVRTIVAIPQASPPKPLLARPVHLP
ncbi:MAG TPA: 4'-phosphopantetheinyl transferase superfamily protein [Candidatus Eremiobacteraceae bacterium]|nr:4'-phosphopantetheinyl transferase superfamily protein [Candidatus Eremiobacteraceae bacterium]